MTSEDTRRKTRFVTLFPEASWADLLKCVGMIPYTMYKNFDYDASLATYPNCSYPFLENEVRGLKLEYLSRTNNDATQDGIDYLMQNARNIDILHLYHLLPRTYDWINLYKELNPSGKIYLKLDTTEGIKDIDITSGCGAWVLNVLKKCHVVSVETLDLFNWLNDNWPIKVEYIPNGFYEYQKKLIRYEDKENIVLNVARIGEYQKGSEILLEAFQQAHQQMTSWKLRLVGPIKPDFQQLIDDYFSQHPELKDKISFIGEISDRPTLEREYSKAKIFCLSSRWEGFCIALSEAAKNGCYLITSNVTCAKDATGNGNYGSIFEIGNTNQLAEELIAASKNEDLLRTNCLAVQEFAHEKFDWKITCQRLHKRLSSPRESQ